jgi:hypothetical protein
LSASLPPRYILENITRRSKADFFGSSSRLVNAVETVQKARSMGATIVYTPITFTDDDHELGPERGVRAEIAAGDKWTYGIYRGTWVKPGSRSGAQ